MKISTLTHSTASYVARHETSVILYNLLKLDIGVVNLHSNRGQRVRVSGVPERLCHGDCRSLAGLKG